jgi:endonuclease/exonuclease/phosphatase (EEP) superfamily protein YafD
MSANVWFRNRDYQAAMDLIAAENPDIVGLLEVDDAWIGQLSALHARYPHKVLYPEDGAYGMALFSRFPLRELAPSPYVTAGTQAGIFVEVQLPGRSFDLLLAHLIAPTTADRAKLRNRQLAGIAQMLRARGGQEQILAGDFNITPWSPYYAQLERQTRMTNAARVSGYRPTWPTGFNPLKIPIDHFLVSGGFEITQFRTAADIGSDHLPIVLDVVVTDLPVSRSL